MRGYADAACAIAGLDSYKWEGMHSCMVVKLMPPQRQRQEHLVGQEGAAGGEWLGGCCVCRAPVACWWRAHHVQAQLQLLRMPSARSCWQAQTAALQAAQP